MVGSVVRLEAVFISSDGSPMDPDEVRMEIWDGEALVVTYDGESIKKAETGHYYRDYVLPDDYKKLTCIFYGEIEAGAMKQTIRIADLVMKNQLVSWARDKISSFGSSSDTLIENAMYDALDELSRVKPIVGYRVLNIYPKNRAYVLDDDVINVQACWLGFSSSYSFGPDFESVLLGGGVYEYADMSTFHNPSLMLLLEQKWDQLKSRYGSTWEYDPDANSLVITPEPKTRGKAVYKYAAKRSLGDIPEKYMSAFKDLMLAESMEAMNLEMGNITSIPVGIGSVSFDAASLEDRAKERRISAYRKLGIGGGGIVIG